MSVSLNKFKILLDGNSLTSLAYRLKHQCKKMGSFGVLSGRFAFELEQEIAFKQVPGSIVINCYPPQSEINSQSNQSTHPGMYGTLKVGVRTTDCPVNE